MARTGVTEAFASLEELQKLQRVTDAALAYLNVEDLLDELLIRVREALGADTAAILLMDPSRSELVARAAKGIEEEVEKRVRIPLGRGFAGRIAASGQPVTIYDLDHADVVNPILRKVGIRSMLGVPLVAQGETIGVLHVGTLVLRRFNDEDTRLLQHVGDRVALAIHAGMYARERAAASSLQRSFLPQRLPEAPGIRLAARYVPASGGDVGGDWYDAFTLPGGALVLAIGDVVGRGVGAAASMSRLRNALRAYALDARSPTEVLERMNRLMNQLEPGDMATALVGVLDPVTLIFRFASAGHLPPIVRTSDGSVRVAEERPAPPLGATDPVRYIEQQVELQPDSTLVLYTDGLVERRSTSLQDGLDRVVEVVRAEATPRDLGERVVRELVAEDKPSDDVAVLIAATDPPLGDRVSVTVPAAARELAGVRRLLERWLAQRGEPPSRAYDVLAASGEALANAVEHAYGPTGGSIELQAEWTPASIVVRVRDDGSWRPIRGLDRGRGTAMMEALCDEMRVRKTRTGTQVELRWEGPAS
jgi:serine phosphatase RsbU (regulator of sigma subunit)/anti-sigma regulatory factor (Ser/Thr protein kinase)